MYSIYKIYKLSSIYKQTKLTSDTICENDNVITEERSAGRTDTATGVMTEEMVMVLKQRRRLREHMRHWEQDGGATLYCIQTFPIDSDRL